MYFQLFPTLQYQFSDEPITRRIVTDIIKRVKVKEAILSTGELYDLYFVKDGETPHVLAAKYYGSSEYHWIPMLTNVIIDPNFDWPMHSVVLQKFIDNKYGGTKYDTHHYQLVSPYTWRHGMVMPHDIDFADYGADLYDPSIESVEEVTNAEYEERLNDDHRQIRLLKPELVSQMTNELTTLLK